MSEIRKCNKLGWSFCDGDCYKCQTTATSNILTDNTNELDVAIIILKNKYELAKNTSYIFNPLAYSLYQTWKEFDSQKYNSYEEEDI